MQTPTTPSVDPPAALRRRRLGLLAAGVLALVFVRLRASWPAWVRLHEWLARSGVSHEVRNLDAWLVLLAVPVVAALLVSRGGLPGALGRLGLSAPAGRAFAAAGLSCLPMFAVGSLVGSAPRWSADLPVACALAPFVEEVFFRGLLCALPVRAAGTRFWHAAALSGILFGLSHVSWNALPTAGTLGVFLLTAAGGAWYAWLLQRWRWNLWLPISLHAFMNLAWLLFGLSADALGGLEANAGRALTVALATAITLRKRTPRANV